jgi:hypothetical protein
VGGLDEHSKEMIWLGWIWVGLVGSPEIQKPFSVEMFIRSTFVLGSWAGLTCHFGSSCHFHGHQKNVWFGPFASAPDNPTAHVRLRVVASQRRRPVVCGAAKQWLMEADATN